MTRHHRSHRLRSLGSLLLLLAAPLALHSCSGGGSPPSDGDQNLEDQGGGEWEIIDLYGPEGGPFVLGERTYTFTNETSGTVEWTVSAEHDWLMVAPQAGILGPGEEQVLLADIDPVVAEALPVGVYSTLVLLKDIGPALQVRLNVYDPEYGNLFVLPRELVEYTFDEGVAGEGDATWTVQNIGTGVAFGAASLNQSWVQFTTQSSFELAEGESLDVTIRLVPDQVADLEPGTHFAQLRFENHDDPTDFDVRGIRLTIESQVDEGQRVEGGLLCLYTFEEGAGSLVSDLELAAGVSSLEITEPEKVSWLPGQLRIDEPTSLIATSENELITTIRAGAEVTLEAWITPANVTQDGPARIFGLSSSPTERNFTLGQGYWDGLPSDAYNVRLRTTETDLNGTPHVGTGGGVAQAALQHVVFTRTFTGTCRLYVDGELLVEEQRGGDMSNWSVAQTLIAGNEIGGGRPWIGTFHLLAIYGRALSTEDVLHNFGVGSGDSEVGALDVDPDSAFRPVATLGEDVVPSSRTCTLTNTGGAPVSWTVAVDQDWLAISGAASGVLEPTASTTFTAEVVSSEALSLAEGWYEGAIHVENLSSGYGTQDLEVELWVRSDSGAGDDNSAGMRSSLESNGVTWTFDQPYLTGKFVTGDWWVVDPGTGVRVQTVSPQPGGGRHGSMLNPQVSGCNGLDDRTGCFDAGLSASFPLDMEAGDALLSTISHLDNGDHTDLIGLAISVDKGPLESAAVLTVLAEEVPGTSFRPPYIGDHRPLYDTAQIRQDRLPSLASASGSISFAGVLPGSTWSQKLARAYERPQVYIQTDWMDRLTHPTQNQANYHREVFTLAGDALSVLISDEPDKETLLLPFLQAGIDLGWAVVNSVERGLAKPPSSSHRGMVIFTGHILGDDTLFNPPGEFRTLWMSYDVADGVSPLTSLVVPEGETWHGSRWAWRQDPGIKEHEHLSPVSEWGSGAPWGQVNAVVRETYRGINSRSWAPTQLAMLAIDGGYEAYAHPPFFNYVDRWMGLTQDWAPFQQVLNDQGINLPYNQGSTASAYMKNMWYAHRGSFDY